MILRPRSSSLVHVLVAALVFGAMAVEAASAAPAGWTIEQRPGVPVARGDESTFALSADGRHLFHSYDDARDVVNDGHRPRRHDLADDTEVVLSAERREDEVPMAPTASGDRVAILMQDTDLLVVDLAGGAVDSSFELRIAGGADGQLLAEDVELSVDGDVLAFTSRNQPDGTADELPAGARGVWVALLDSGGTPTSIELVGITGASLIAADRDLDTLVWQDLDGSLVVHDRLAGTQRRNDSFADLPSAYELLDVAGDGVIVWYRQDDLGGGGQVHNIRRYDVDRGGITTVDFDLATPAEVPNVLLPTVAVAEDGGRFALFWEGEGVLARESLAVTDILLDGEGRPERSALDWGQVELVTPGPDADSEPEVGAVAMSADGQVVVWRSRVAGDPELDTSGDDGTEHTLYVAWQGDRPWPDTGGGGGGGGGGDTFVAMLGFGVDAQVVGSARGNVRRDGISVDADAAGLLRGNLRDDELPLWSSVLAQVRGNVRRDGVGVGTVSAALLRGNLQDQGVAFSADVLGDPQPTSPIDRDGDGIDDVVEGGLDPSGFALRPLAGALEARSGPLRWSVDGDSDGDGEVDGPPLLGGGALRTQHPSAQEQLVNACNGFRLRLFGQGQGAVRCGSLETLLDGLTGVSLGTDGSQVIVPSGGHVRHAVGPFRVDNLGDVAVWARTPAGAVVVVEPGTSWPAGSVGGSGSGPVGPVPESPNEPDAEFACREDEVVEAPDVAPTSVHHDAIGCLLRLGLLEGLADGRVAPGADVRRGQFASLLVRFLDLTAPGLVPTEAPDAFPDDDGTFHEVAADRLAAAGLLAGNADGRGVLDQPLTRAQAASLLWRSLLALGLEPKEQTGQFTDVDGTPHDDAIRQLAARGILAGVDDRRFLPATTLSRAQLASVLVRTGQVIAEQAANDGP